MAKKRTDISKGFYESDCTETIKSDNLHVSLSVSSLFLPNISRPEVPKITGSRSLRKKTTKTLLPVVVGRRKGLPISGIPKNAAVHFGKFYSLEKKSTKNERVINEMRTNKSELPVRDKPRSEFTRQMVHKLERLVGSEYYARQVSALLEETVEAPNFVVNQPPDDNFVFNEKTEISTYPLWYKEPDKINYASPTNESSSCSIETQQANYSTRQMKSCESSAKSKCTLTTSDSRRFSDYDDFENDKSSVFSSKVACISSENTEEEESDDDDYQRVE